MATSQYAIQHIQHVCKEQMYVHMTCTLSTTCDIGLITTLVNCALNGEVSTHHFNLTPSTIIKFLKLNNQWFLPTSMQHPDDDWSLSAEAYYDAQDSIKQPSFTNQPSFWLQRINIETIHEHLTKTIKGNLDHDLDNIV